MSTFKANTLFLLAHACLFFKVYSQDQDTHPDTQDHATDTATTYLTEEQIWGFGFLAGFGISLIGFLAALVLLLGKKCCSLGCFEMIIKFLFSLACGALLGDSLIHILAESYANVDMDPLIISCILICSILLFIVLQKIMESCGVTHEHWTDDEKHNHDHGNQIKNAEALSESKIELENSFKKNIKEEKIVDLKQNNPELEPKQDNQEKGKKCQDCCKQYSGKGSAGYMNLIGSLIHNFIDGLALGIAFATGSPTEIVPVLVAIIAHQIPRELGDVAILLKNKFDEIQTVVCNGVINLFSLVGVLIGLAVVNLDEIAKGYILIFVAGNFLFIAADIWRHMFKNKGEGRIGKNALQFFGFATGVGAMFALTLLETDDHDH